LSFKPRLPRSTRFPYTTLFRSAIVQQAVAETRTDDARGRFRPQRDAVAAAILERVHLLLDDVGQLADRAAEELRALENRNADARSEEHTSELQSREKLVCRLLL